MTDREHLAFDEAQQAVQLAVQAVAEFYARFPDTPAAAAKNRVAMALDSLETAADQLAAARQRFAQVDDPYANPGPLPPFHKTFTQDRAGRHPADH